ncbi:hypothetical protein ACFSJY_00260 [Thalassotalea euphylliae]|uniref:hypothetical protein n=1 Tax=Thalassotalea euphylliae TaxID=1655234 RepID=UPI003637482D
MKRCIWYAASCFAALPVVAADFIAQVIGVDGQPVENMVVYITPKSGIAELPANEQALVIDQKDKKFAPYLTVMQRGQRIQFTNHDDITHHIYSVSGKNRFEFKLKAGTNKVTAPMHEAEEVAMGCNIHDWMSGYALVVDTPYFGKTDEAGQVTFDIVSSGMHEVTVWHPQLSTNNNRQTTEVSIDNQSTRALYQIALTATLKPIPKQENQDEFEFLEEYE